MTTPAMTTPTYITYNFHEETDTTATVPKWLLEAVASGELLPAVCQEDSLRVVRLHYSLSDLMARCPLALLPRYVPAARSRLNSLSAFADRLNAIMAEDNGPTYQILIGGTMEHEQLMSIVLAVRDGRRVMYINNHTPDMETVELNPGLFTVENLTEILRPSFSVIPADIRVLKVVPANNNG